MKSYMSFIVRLVSVCMAGLLSVSVFAQSSAGEVWQESPAGLPYCRIVDRYAASPYLLGNSRMHLLASPDGSYQILSGERVWAGFNTDAVRPDYGKNRAALITGRRTQELVGPNSAVVRNNCEVYTGVGFVRYDYRLEAGVKCSRMISVMPSEKVDGGYPCFLITVSLTNTGRGVKRVTYEEVFSPSYLPVSDRNLKPEDRALVYQMFTEISFRCLKAFFMPAQQKYIKYPACDEVSRYEVAPQSVFLYAKDAFLVISDGEFKAQFTDVKIKSGETRTFNVVIGVSDSKEVRPLAEELLAHAERGQFGAFESFWKKKLPKFDTERTRAIRREMYMNAHALEAASVYNRYFDETFVMGESLKPLQTGENLSNWDHLQHALPASYTDSELAKSVLRYVMKHAGADGRIYDGNTGYGYIASSYTGSHDLQIHFLHALSEYLRVTGDYAFLDERVSLYPVGKDEYITVMQFAERCFLYLRDEVVLDADIVGIMKNQALVSSYFPSLIEQLRISGKASGGFIGALQEYTDSEWEKYRKTDDSVFNHLDEDFGANARSKSLYDYLRALE